MKFKTFFRLLMIFNFYQNYFYSYKELCFNVTINSSFNLTSVVLYLINLAEFNLDVVLLLDTKCVRLI